ncbi:hypothetical protein, partial [Salmonella sp. SAL4457]|uniref:hypothetical protein n=1 Tax=Salmonella sp. SAL4457 TaxID=3159912 RepID=UPI00397B1F90
TYLSQQWDEKRAKESLIAVKLANDAKSRAKARDDRHRFTTEIEIKALGRVKQGHEGWEKAFGEFAARRAKQQEQMQQAW